MTPTEKQKCIAEQAVYGDLRVYRENYGNPIQLVVIEKDYKNRANETVVLFALKGDIFKPILRPLDLTKEITHKGYNNDQPFIPLVELAKIMYKRDGREPFDFKYDAEDNTVSYYKNIITNTEKKEMLAYYFDIDLLSIKELDFINMLHFDTRGLIKQGEAISTNEVNPYEV